MKERKPKGNKCEMNCFQKPDKDVKKNGKWWSVCQKHYKRYFKLKNKE